MIKPSPASGDHQVRLVVDGFDIIGGSLGLDPPDFFAQRSLRSSGTAVVARCLQCGNLGCDDTEAIVTFAEEEVRWSLCGRDYLFQRDQYVSALAACANDHTWEDSKPEAERLITDMFRGLSIDDGYIFDWASAREGAGKIALSFTRGFDQRLIEFGWDDLTSADAVRNAERIYHERLKKSMIA